MPHTTPPPPEFVKVLRVLEIDTGWMNKTEIARAISRRKLGSGSIHMLKWWVDIGMVEKRQYHTERGRLAYQYKVTRVPPEGLEFGGDFVAAVCAAARADNIRTLLEHMQKAVTEGKRVRVTQKVSVDEGGKRKTVSRDILVTDPGKLTTSDPSGFDQWLDYDGEPVDETYLKGYAAALGIDLSEVVYDWSSWKPPTEPSA
jgi:hypothetical protein